LSLIEHLNINVRNKFIMRQLIRPFEPGAVSISKMEFDIQFRDDIPQILRGLQSIYLNPTIREEVFQILETIIPAEIDRQNGRPGMALWTILVMGI